MTTPFFPAWRACLGPLKTTVENLHSKPLPYLQGLFGSWIPKETLAQSKQGPNSRQRVFPLALTFWAFLGQILSPGTSCREILRQVMALFCLQGHAPLDEQTGTMPSAAGLPAEGRTGAPVRYPLLRAEDEEEVERMFQRLKSVGHLESKNSEDK